MVRSNCKMRTLAFFMDWNFHLVFMKLLIITIRNHLVDATAGGLNVQYFKVFLRAVWSNRILVQSCTCSMMTSWYPCTGISFPSFCRLFWTFENQIHYFHFFLYFFFLLFCHLSSFGSISQVIRLEIKEMLFIQTNMYN